MGGGSWIHESRSRCGRVWKGVEGWRAAYLDPREQEQVLEDVPPRAPAARPRLVVVHQRVDAGGEAEKEGDEDEDEVIDVFKEDQVDEFDERGDVA